MAGLEGKVALITGAGGMRGVGRAATLKLAALGADIAITDVRRDPDNLPPAEVRLGWRSIDSVTEEVQALERRCLPIYCDLGQSDQIQDMVNQVIERFGRIDILVNNARAIIGRDRVPVTELSEDVWHHFLAINTTAVFLCTKMAGREMVRLGNGGRIINIASNAGKQASAMGTAYSASKFAVLGITQASALDLAPYGITVNAVCPGPINTDRMSYWERDRAAERGISLEEFRSGIVAESGERTPLGRIAEAEDIANMVAFLSSEDASFITGQAYNVNGGILFH
jgi:3-oxoacyl-[acyl-carrier protein] reductase/meso-butanediol dehydrogenase/(S,S)-butanediol dehydrogenase/diacetyl reductase